MIDAHCHPQFPQYDQDRDEVIKRGLAAGVKMICVGTDYQMSVAAVELATKYDGVWASVGLHPNDANFQFSIFNFQTIADKPKVAAIGEVGLDYYRTKEPEKQKLQRNVLEQFIDLAVSKNKPLIIHCRDAHPDMIELLKAYHLSLKSGGVIHSFTGAWPEAKKYIDLGLYIGLNGIITFTNQYDETVRNASLDRILLETDAPFLAPVPHRGKRNEPLWVVEVAKKIAAIKNRSLDEVAQTTTANARKLFALPG